MVPSGYDCAASVLLCAEDNAAILGLDDDEEDCSWAAAAATPPRIAADAAAAAEGFLVDHPVQSDECVAALVETEKEHMPADGYPQMLLRRPGALDLAAVRRDAIDWIWKVIEHFNFAPLTAVLSVNYLDRFLSVYPLPVVEANSAFEGKTIKRMELLVLSTLKWRMQAVTACSFIDYFLRKFNDHDAPSMLAFSRSTDLILSTAKGADFLVFRPSEIAASVALAAFGERNTSVVERATTTCKYINKERVLRCYELIQDKIAMGTIVLKSAGSSMFSVPQSPIGVLDAAACLSQQSDDTAVGSPATCYQASSASKRRRIGR
ncbi:hypothetical protein CFC21_089318 [Triticum aestivum]|uniref:Cyclin C-terminal domain-containing protein n=1 Tax=Triticum aestivum TaxID=4565 RepID=A0A9R1ILG2_WHEAT|nr:hypothetical protein CFC21_089318 [Triticum aestivum]